MSLDHSRLTREARRQASTLPHAVRIRLERRPGMQRWRRHDYDGCRSDSAEVEEAACHTVSDKFSHSKWDQPTDSSGQVRTLGQTADTRDGRRRRDFCMRLSRLETIGVQYAELERMAGKTMLGLLAIKNNVSAFMQALSFLDNVQDALNTQDLYGNTPSHYFALRGDEKCAFIAHLSEMGACMTLNYARQSPQVIQSSRCIVCCEQGEPFGASYCAVRQVVTVIRCA